MAGVSRCSSALTVETSLERQSLENDIAQIKRLGLDSLGSRELSEDSEDDFDDDENSVDEDDTEAGEANPPTDTLSLEDLSQLPVNMHNCLFLNQLYQEFISESIERLELLLAQNRKQQKVLQEELNSVMMKKRKSYLTTRNQRSKFLTVFASPYFKDKKGFAQPYNDDTKAKLAQHELDLYLRPPRLWSPDEKELLHKAVRETALEHTLQPLMTRKELLCEKNIVDSESGKANIDVRLEETDLEIQQTRSLSDSVLFGSREKNHDWMKIANIDFDGTRSAEECQLMWQNYLHPAINKSRWTRDEEARLRTLVGNFSNDWVTIAQELKTDRTAHQCMERYQAKLNDELLRTKWTPEEDQLLVQVVESCRLGEIIPWHQVSYYMEGRTRNQVYRRWIGQLSPELTRGKWTVKEDMLLIAGVMRYGYRWSKIAKLIPGRQSLKCRDRFVNSLDPTVVFSPWNGEEDENLMNLYSNMGPKWAEIARFLPGRTDSMVATRYRRLLTAGDEWKGIPSTNQPLRCSNYRCYVYHKLLGQLRPQGMDMKLQPNFSWVLKLISPKEADKLIERLQHAMTKPTLKPGAKCQVLTDQDKEFISYFSVVVTPKPAGRPYAEVDVDEKSEVYTAATAAQLKAIGSDVTHADLLDCPSSPSHFGKPSVALLPPTASTLAAFKALLLSRREFQNECSVKSMANDDEEDETHSVKMQKMNEECPLKNTGMLPFPSLNDDVHYATLAARFASLFVWPALLSTLQPPAEPEPTLKVKRKRNNVVRAATKRKYKKPWVGERMRKLSMMRWKNKKKSLPDEDTNNNPPSTSPKSDSARQKPEPAPYTESTVTKRRRGRPKGHKLINKQAADLIPSRQSVRERKPTYKVKDGSD